MQQHAIFRSNAQRMRYIGQTMSAQRKKNRTKRININVRINVIAYLAEVLGGLVAISLAFLPSLTNTTNSNGYIYITIMILYGNIIPSCYLMNNTNFKSFVMDNGWIAAMSTVYSTNQGETKTTNEQQAEKAPSTQNITEDENNSRGISPSSSSSKDPKEDINGKDQNSAEIQSWTDRVLDMKKRVSFSPVSQNVLDKDNSNSLKLDFITPDYTRRCITTIVDQSEANNIILLPNQVDYS